MTHMTLVCCLYFTYVIPIATKKRREAMVKRLGQKGPCW